MSRAGRILEFQDGLGGRVGDGVHGVPPVAGIADVVDPDLVPGALPIGARPVGAVRVAHRVVVEGRLAGRDGLDEARVGAPSHHEAGERLGAGEEELPGIEPSDHRQPLGPRVRPPQEREAASRQSPGDREGLALARRVRGLGRIRGRPRGVHGLDIVTRASTA